MNDCENLQEITANEWFNLRNKNIAQNYVQDLNWIPETGNKRYISKEFNKLKDNYAQSKCYFKDNKLNTYYKCTKRDMALYNIFHCTNR